MQSIENVYIAVMGTTGSGIPSFIALCTGQSITAVEARIENGKIFSPLGPYLELIR